jgi:anti-anti-sigma factor
MIAKTETLGGCKILRVSGRIDFESALDFEHHINAMIQEAGDCYIIELSQVELLSSAGLRVMLSTAKRVAHRNAGLALAAPSQVVRQVFEISHFNLLFKIYPSVPAAIAALKGTAEEAPLEESTQESPEASAPDGLEETKSTEQVLPSVELERQAPRQNVETTPSGSIAPGSPPPIVAVPPPPPTSPGMNAPQPPAPLSVVGTPTVALNRRARRNGSPKSGGRTDPTYPAASPSPNSVGPCSAFSGPVARSASGGHGLPARGEISGPLGGSRGRNQLSLQRR